jgi:hypothetical protein
MAVFCRTVHFGFSKSVSLLVTKMLTLTQAIRRLKSEPRDSRNGCAYDHLLPKKLTAKSAAKTAKDAKGAKKRHG